MAGNGTPHHPQVGAPDPERDTSPIMGGSLEEQAVEPNVGDDKVCYFNSVPFPIGEFVLSGSEILRCEAPGVWVREGELPGWPGPTR